MNKPIFKKSFSVDDIHKLREYNYERTKDFTKKELIEDINKGADEFERKILRVKKDKNKTAVNI